MKLAIGSSAFFYSTLHRDPEKTEYCYVDLLVLKKSKINMTVEIEKSDVKPTQTYVKFLTSTLAN